MNETQRDINRRLAFGPRMTLRDWIVGLAQAAVLVAVFTLLTAGVWIALGVDIG